MLNTRVKGATASSVELHDGTVISSYTLIWAGGVTPNPLIANLPCDHNKGKIVADNYLEVNGYHGVFALGDCASITDPNSGKPYPPTAQHALRQGEVAAKNIISAINSRRKSESNKKIAFDYKTKGMMAIVGKRHGVGILFGHKVHGFVAWWIWRLYYWANLPTVEKKFRVMVDWTIDVFFKRDVTRLKTFAEEKGLPVVLNKQKLSDD